MTEEKTQGQKEKEFNDIQEILMNNMTMNSFLYGANALKNSFGKEGSNIADSYMNSPDVAKQKQELFAQMQEEDSQLGIGYAPEITNYELVKNAKKAVEGSKQKLTLGNLEKITKKFMPGLDFQVADKFKDKSKSDYIEKIQKAGGNPEKIDEETQDAMSYFNILSQAYEKGTVAALMQNTYLPQFNEKGKKLGEKYQSEKKDNQKSSK